MPINYRQSLLLAGMLTTASFFGSADFSAAQSDQHAGSAPKTIPVKRSPEVLDVALSDQTIAPILGTTIDGDGFDLRTFAAGEPVVVALTSTSCPLCKKYGPTLAAMEKEYAAKGIKFAFLGAIRSDSISDARQTRDALGLQGPYVLDTTGHLLEKLDAHSTTEVFLLDSDLKVVYRGAVDDQFGLGYTRREPGKEFLRTALDQFLAGQPIEVANTSAPGCAIMHPKEKPAEELQYYADIFPIVQNHCVVCHREKGIGPFSLESADDLIAHAGMVQQVIEDKTMPPWFAQPDEKAPHKWMNDSALPTEERSRLLAWLDGSQTLGEKSENLVAREFKVQWNIGTPDLVVQLPEPIPVQASGFMDYEHREIMLELDEEKWVQAVEVRPTAADVVHHVLVYHLPKDETEPRIDERTPFLAAYAPGISTQIFPSGFGKRLPAGSKLLVQMHYTPNGQATEDQTEIAFRFAKEKPENEVIVIGLADTNLNIPPGESNHPEGHYLDINDQSIVLLSLFPHMHLRGKAFRYELTEPDGNKTTLLDIPAYDFNWQLGYRFQSPLPIEKGSRIEVTGWFDNSSGNPAITDRENSQWVYWGDQTYNEMLLGYLEYYVPNAEQPVVIEPTRQHPTAEQLHTRFDPNKDGTLETSELPANRQGLDRNRDGQVSVEEIKQAVQRRN